MTLRAFHVALMASVTRWPRRAATADSTFIRGLRSCVCTHLLLPCVMIIRMVPFSFARAGADSTRRVCVSSKQTFGHARRTIVSPYRLDEDWCLQRDGQHREGLPQRRMGRGIYSAESRMHVMARSMHHEIAPLERSREREDHTQPRQATHNDVVWRRCV